MGRVFVLGLDGASPAFIKKFVSEGHLPNFKKVIEGGCFGNLKSTIPPLTPCAWSSFMTGKNPGKHGLTEFYYIKEDLTLGVNKTVSGRETTLWSHASKYGKRCCILNVPFTFPAEEVNGVLVSGFDSPGLESDFTYPSDFKGEILDKFPKYQISETSRYSDNELSRRKFFRDFMEDDEMKMRLADNLYHREKWDLFMVVLMGVDKAQHFYMRFMGPEHPKYDEHLAADYGDYVLKAYSRMDDYLGVVLGWLGKESTLVIMSDHGAGPLKKNVYMNNWLRQRGYLFLKKSWKIKVKGFLINAGINQENFVKAGLMLGASKLNKHFSFRERRMNNQITRLGLSFIDNFGYSLGDIDWSRTKIYSFGYHGSFYINKKIVGRDYQNLVAEVVGKLKELNDPDTGRRIVDRVWARDEVYSGRYIDRMPDIVFSIGDYSYVSTSMFSFPTNRIFSEPLTMKSGDHRLEGLLMAYGRNVEKCGEVNASIIDLFPTICKLLEIIIPDDVDGEDISSISSGSKYK